MTKLSFLFSNLSKLNYYYNSQDCTKFHPKIVAKPKCHNFSSFDAIFLVFVNCFVFAKRHCQFCFVHEKSIQDILFQAEAACTNEGFTPKKKGTKVTH